MDVIFKRVSTRKFQEKPVDRVKIEAMLRAAMAAPSAGNQQPWEFYVTENKETIQKLSECSPYARCAAGAPLVIAACYRTEGIRYPENIHADMGASVENMLLEATAQGVGNVWLGIAPLQERMDAVREVLALPECLDTFALIAVGYPAEEKVQQDRYEEERVHYC